MIRSNELVFPHFKVQDQSLSVVELYWISPWLGKTFFLQDPQSFRSWLSMVYKDMYRENPQLCFYDYTILYTSFSGNKFIAIQLGFTFLKE